MRTASAEFGSEFKLSDAERILINEAGLDDTSWHNDVCPSWAPAGEDYPRLWVDASDPTERERADGERFTVTDADHETLYEGGELVVAIAILKGGVR